MRLFWYWNLHVEDKVNKVIVVIFQLLYVTGEARSCSDLSDLYIRFSWSAYLEEVLSFATSYKFARPWRGKERVKNAVIWACLDNLSIKKIWHRLKVSLIALETAMCTCAHWVTSRATELGCSWSTHCCIRHYTHLTKILKEKINRKLPVWIII